MERFNRFICEKVIKGLKAKRLVFIIGPRRVGKTTLMKIVFDRFEFNKSLFIDIETLSEFSMFENYKNFIRYMEVNGIKTKDVALIGLDEVQHIKSINPILKSLVDHRENWHIICSGSSSLGILKNVKESLAGRKRIFNLSPLYFKEFLNFLQKDKLIQKIKNIKNQEEWDWIKEEVLALWQLYLVYGGMPEVVLTVDTEEKIDELNDISRSYITMDIYDYLRGEVEITRYNKLMKLIANNSGTLLNISKLSQISGIKRNKVEDAFFLLESSHIIKKLPPFFTNKNKEITKAEKIIFFDTGIRNALIEDFRNMDLRQDKGKLWEIAVAKNLRDCRIHYYRTKHQTEIDFIIKKDKKIIPVEVKSGDTKKVSRGLKYFMDRYNIEKGYVITRGTWKTEVNKNQKIHFIPAPLFTFSQPWE